jgi:hypothetical protein
MTSPLRRRRPEPRIVAVTNHWTVLDPRGAKVLARDVVVEWPDGRRDVRPLREDSEHLARFLERAAVAA